MAVKILIKRQFKENCSEEAFALLRKFRHAAMSQKGHISGETWVNHYDPTRITVVSTWQTVEDWIRWEESDERAGIEAELKDILAATAQFEVYDVGGKPD